MQIGGEMLIACEDVTVLLVGLDNSSWLVEHKCQEGVWTD